MIKLVPFTLDSRRFALPLPSVERVVRVVDISPLPGAPEIVTGIINLHGRIIPVVDIRKRFQMPARMIHLSDQIVISQTSRRTIGILVDETGGVIDCPEDQITTARDIIPELDYIEGVARLEDGMILIHDMERFLSLEEEEALSDALKTGQ